jgi:hypothetical protein
MAYGSVDRRGPQRVHHTAFANHVELAAAGADDSQLIGGDGDSEPRTDARALAPSGYLVASFPAWPVLGK